MPRNFFSRLELAFPVLDPRLYQFIEEVIIPAYLYDSVKAKQLTPEGVWRKRSGIKIPEPVSRSPYFENPPLRAQSLFEELALARYSKTVLSRSYEFNATKDIDHRETRPSSG
jgi:hypothetical protein